MNCHFTLRKLSFYSCKLTYYSTTLSLYSWNWHSTLVYHHFTFVKLTRGLLPGEDVAEHQVGQDPDESHDRLKNALDPDVGFKFDFAASWEGEGKRGREREAKERKRGRKGEEKRGKARISNEKRGRGGKGRQKGRTRGTLQATSGEAEVDGKETETAKGTKGRDRNKQ